MSSVRNNIREERKERKDEYTDGFSFSTSYLDAKRGYFPDNFFLQQNTMLKQNIHLEITNRMIIPLFYVAIK